MDLQIQMSPNLDKLAPALARVQSKLHAVTKNANNPFFKSKYADLTAVIEESKPLLIEEGFSLTQWPCGGVGNSIGLANLLLHESGQWLYSEFYFESKDASPQGKGGCITYMRRYGQLAILNMATEDDDGNKASYRQAPPVQSFDPGPPVVPGFNTQEVIPHIGANAAMQVKKLAHTGPVVENGIIKFGKFVDKRMDQIPAKDWDNYFKWWADNEAKTGKPIPKNVMDLHDEVNKYRASRHTSQDSGIPEYDDTDIPF